MIDFSNPSSWFFFFVNPSLFLSGQCSSKRCNFIADFSNSSDPLKSPNPRFEVPLERPPDVEVPFSLKMKSPRFFSPPSHLPSLGTAFSFLRATPPFSFPTLSFRRAVFFSPDSRANRPTSPETSLRRSGNAFLLGRPLFYSSFARPFFTPCPGKKPVCCATKFPFFCP